MINRTKKSNERRTILNSSGTMPFGDRREQTRQETSGSIFYEYKNLLIRANLKNLSPTGFFIRAREFFLKGDIINIAIPQANDAYEKFMGEVAWSSDEGCGVRLLGEL